MKKADIYELNRDWIGRVGANVLLGRSKLLAEVLVVILEVDCPTWRRLVDKLMPGYDWDAIRTDGPLLARGIVQREGFAEIVYTIVPGVKPSLERLPEPGVMQAVVCAEDGATVYEIKLMEIAS